MLSPEEIATRVNLNPVTIYRHLRSGRLRGAKLGNRWRVSEADLQAWLDGNRPTPDPGVASPGAIRRRTDRHHLKVVSEEAA